MIVDLPADLMVSPRKASGSAVGVPSDLQVVPEELPEHALDACTPGSGGDPKSESEGDAEAEVPIAGAQAVAEAPATVAPEDQPPAVVGDDQQQQADDLPGPPQSTSYTMPLHIAAALKGLPDADPATAVMRWLATENARLQAEVLKLSAHVSHLTANMQKPVQAGVAVDAPQPRSYASIVSPHRVMVQQVVHAIDADGAERAKRACNVRVKGLPEEADESAEALHAKVQDMLSPLHVGELEFRAERVKSRVPMAPRQRGQVDSCVFQEQS